MGGHYWWGYTISTLSDDISFCVEEKLKAKVVESEMYIAKLIKEKSQLQEKLQLINEDITTAGNTISTLIDRKYISILCRR